MSRPSLLARLPGRRRRDRSIPPGTSALLALVPELEPILAGLPYDTGVPGLPPHASVLYPFASVADLSPAVERDLEALIGSFPAFEYRLDQTRRFPGVLYLAPTPADPFVEMTRVISASWPAFPPYGGAFAEIVPHVTVALGEEPAGLAAAVEPLLPVQSSVRALELRVYNGDGVWMPRRCFSLGGVTDR